MRFVEIKNLEKTYFGRSFFKRSKSAVKAVDRVSFGIEKKSVFGLVGESGCGKTSLVRSVLYLDPPTTGEVWIDNPRIEIVENSVPVTDIIDIMKK